MHAERERVREGSFHVKPTRRRRQSLPRTQQWKAAALAPNGIHTANPAVPMTATTHARSLARPAFKATLAASATYGPTPRKRTALPYSTALLPSMHVQLYVHPSFPCMCEFYFPSLLFTWSTSVTKGKILLSMKYPVRSKI
jgi:hypothetical protein